MIRRPSGSPGTNVFRKAILLSVSVSGNDEMDRGLLAGEMLPIAVNTTLVQDGKSVIYVVLPDLDLTERVDVSNNSRNWSTIAKEINLEFLSSCQNENYPRSHKNKVTALLIVFCDDNG